jgi:hypothetical protein
MGFVVNPRTGWVLETYVGNAAPTAEGTIARSDRVRLALKLKLRGAACAKLAKRSHHRTFAHTRAKAATWGNKRSQGNSHHCYALAVWEMHGSEQVAGTEALQNTEEADVPGWESGDFIDQEEWVGFKNGPEPYWTEMGQAAGEYYNCCTLRWFWAYNNASHYHDIKPDERFRIGDKEYSAYFQLAAGNGVWCFDIGPYGEIQIKCVGGFETYSKDLETGAEYAANQAPVVKGHGLVNWWKEQPWYRAALGLYNEYERQSYNGMCISKYAPVPAPGNVNTGTYGKC